MKKLFSLCFLTLIFACQQNSNSTSESSSSDASSSQKSNGLILKQDADPAFQFENLTVVPILADENLLAAHKKLENLATIESVMQTQGFRIMEKKQFGRQSENWYNGLTVANKTSVPVFLMSGDVVTGGNQDRVIAADQVIAANTIKNIEVFCVERGRSTFYDPSAPESVKKVAAFNGYYNVASVQVRQAIQRTGNQSEVWNAVDKVTSANAATTSTNTYAGLETANTFKEKRENCLLFFEGKFKKMPQMIGLAVLVNDKILGIDIFGSPQLFQQKAKSLLHGYATDALSQNKSVENLPPSSKLNEQFQTIANVFVSSEKSGGEHFGKFTFEGLPVHVFTK